MSKSATKKKVVPLHEVRTKSGASAIAEGDVISILDERGGVVVRFDASTGEARIRAPRGDLTLEAAGAVRLISEREVSIEAPRLSAVVDEAAWSVGAWHLRSERIFEQAGDLYRDVRGLVRTRAGRVRTVVEGVAQLFAKRSEIVSKDNTIVDGKRVLLG